MDAMNFSPDKKTDLPLVRQVSQTLKGIDHKDRVIEHN